MIKAVGFDVGHTLVYYNNPLNWSSLYVPALAKAAEGISVVLTDSMAESAVAVLTKFNTRVHYREWEVTSETIFGEIISGWNIGQIDSKALRAGFYSFFQTNACLYPDAEETLAALRRAGTGVGVLTDVAYGMDDEYSLKDFAPLSKYIDTTLTSVDVGYRKPHPAGFERLLDFFGLRPGEMIYIGDEEKDITGANKVGMVSVLINRSDARKDFGQRYTVSALSEVLNIVSE